MSLSHLSTHHSKSFILMLPSLTHSLAPLLIKTSHSFAMHIFPAFLLASGVSLISAAPAPVQVGVDDVILYGNGKFTLMKREDFAALEEARNSATAPPKPSHLDESLTTFTGNETNVATAQPLTKRAEQVLIVPLPASRFLGWDVQMSAVVKGAPTTISVSSGYSITNGISVNVGSSLTLIKDFLSVSMSVDYSQSWTSTQSQLFSAPVPADKFGAFVSNPWTNRASGNIWRGTIGGDGSLEHYQADSFESKSFDSMNWVDGVISLCVGDTFPLKRCLGEGTL
ncbi:hypothetical protein GQ44DRAFT_716399 [Phaeosphaeriaceae sp. PMI808]|nr:hypothetical protein GQ44DRAFT_716399 [Phaeosphaeriaceae sp. PMI808]